MSEDLWFRWCCLKPNCLNSEKSLPFWLSSFIFWLRDNVPVSQLAFICILKGGKYKKQANEWCGQLQSEQLLEIIYWSLCFKKIDLICRDPVLLQLASSASLISRCAESMVLVSMLQRDRHGWQWEAHCPCPPWHVVCMYQDRSSPSSDTGKV